MISSTIPILSSISTVENEVVVTCNADAFLPDVKLGA
jgi:hypothetical protein